MCERLQTAGIVFAPGGLIIIKLVLTRHRPP
jgi:hypothetical protein